MTNKIDNPLASVCARLESRGINLQAKREAWERLTMVQGFRMSLFQYLDKLDETLSKQERGF